MYVLRIEIEIDGKDDADARLHAHQALSDIEKRTTLNFSDFKFKLQKRYENKPPRKVRFP